MCFFSNFSNLKETKLDFGSNIALNSSPKLYLHISNNTAITAPYAVCLENYFAKPPTPPEKKKADQDRNLRWDIFFNVNLFVPLSKEMLKKYLCSPIFCHSATS